MKKVLCLLMAAVMCLGLTGCAAKSSVDMTGEWYMISNVEKEEETHSWTWSPFDDFIVRDVNDELQLMQPESGLYWLWLIHKEPSGEWQDYDVALLEYDNFVMSFTKGNAARYRMGDEWNAAPFTYKLSGDTLSVMSNGAVILEGPIERWDKDVLFWDVAGDSDIVFIRRDSVVDDNMKLK